MRWLIADSLCCPEQFFCSHLDSYSWYLEQAGEDVSRLCWGEDTDTGSYDVAFVLDRYDAGARIDARKRIAQVAAITNPLPWDVRKPDGSPAYDLVISSIPAMVDEAREHGCRAEYQALAFDHRALSCGMGVAERDIDLLFIGSVDGNHIRRGNVLHALGDRVTVMSPTFGRSYYAAISRARVVLHVGAEWAEGSANALRIFEGAGMGAQVISDGTWDGPGDPWWHEAPSDSVDWMNAYQNAIVLPRSDAQGIVLAWHGYHRRIPQLIEWARSL